MAQLRHVPLDGRQPELFRPDSAWVPPSGPLPRLWLRDLPVGMDTETRDGGLASGIGPGWVYNMGWLCGVSVACGHDHLYVPVRHPDTECRPVGEVVEWVEEILRRCEVHFFNAGYDLGWLWHEGVRVWPEHMHDAYISSVMMDENQLSYELDDCCDRADVPRKDTALLEEAARAYGVDPKKGLWQLPARFVGPYAEQDAASTLQLSQQNMEVVRDQRMDAAYRTEIDLIRVLYDMRKRGIPVNTDVAEQSRVRIRERRDLALEEVSRLAGWRVGMTDMRSPEALRRVFETQGIVLPRTKATKAHPDGLPSVQKQWLMNLDHPLGGHVRAARQFDDLAEKFMGTYVLGHEHRGRIHATVHQLRDSEGGARTMRLSYSDPPLHQMPARGEDADMELVRQIRSAFEAERGEWWAAPDYSGQEPRILVHIASVCGITQVEDLVRQYRENPRTDYHSMVAAIIGLPRKKAKDINQGLAYGMGLDKLARVLAVSVAEAQDMLDTYHHRLPYMGKTTDHCSNLAKTRGWIKLLDGARCHFDQWQPVGMRKEVAVWGRDVARAKWPNARLERAYTYRALNRGCQGGAARQMKRAMVLCHREGITPLVTMHDELGASVHSRRQAETMQRCMIEAIQLRVPMLVDMEVGRTWGDAKHTMEEVGL